MRWTPELIEAATRLAAFPWDMGDALVEECDGTLDGPRGYKAVEADLRTNGQDITVKELKTYRETALAFPPNTRVAKVPSWIFHALRNQPHRDKGVAMMAYLYRHGKVRTKGEAKRLIVSLNKLEKRERDA